MSPYYGLTVPLLSSKCPSFITQVTPNYHPTVPLLPSIKSLEIKQPVDNFLTSRQRLALNQKRAGEGVGCSSVPLLSMKCPGSRSHRDA